jgi:hypothetical protein
MHGVVYEDQALGGGSLGACLLGGGCFFTDGRRPVLSLLGPGSRLGHVVLWLDMMSGGDRMALSGERATDGVHYQLPAKK